MLLDLEMSDTAFDSEVILFLSKTSEGDLKFFKLNTNV